MAAQLGSPVDVDAFLRAHWEVVPDPENVEFIRAPDKQLELASYNGGRLIGDCDDAATLAAALTAANGWPCHFVAIRLQNDYEYSHVWLRCPMGHDVIDIDPIVAPSSLPITKFAESMTVPTLGGTMRGLGQDPRPRSLTDSEVRSFLMRHPIEAGQVFETEAVMQAGLYDYDYNPYTQWKLPGVIPPWGMQVEDSVFTLVTIFPARDGTWRYSGFSPELADINEEPYEPPPFDRGPFDDLADLVQLVAVVGIGVFLLSRK